MKIKIYEPEEYDDLLLPKIVYKYRDWNNKWHKTILVEQLVYLASPDSFEDKLDCNIPVRYDLLTEKEILKIYFEQSKSLHPKWDRKEHRIFARDWQKKKLLSDLEKINENREISLQKFNRKYGVLCLTEDPTNNEVWEKYSANHKGFCVGFNTKELFRDTSKFGLQGHVEYVEELPTLTYYDDYIKRGTINTLHKLNHWSFEKEYRVSKINEEPINDDWRSVHIDNDYFLEIIFGKDMDEKHKEEIIEITKDKFKNVVYKQANINSSNGVIIIDNYLKP